MKKSKGLIAVRSAASSTVTSSVETFPVKTSRASQLPNGSCCQWTKCWGGSTVSE